MNEELVVKTGFSKMAVSAFTEQVYIFVQLTCMKQTFYQQIEQLKQDKLCIKTVHWARCVTTMTFSR